jgi:hypothetical protein
MRAATAHDAATERKQMIRPVQVKAGEVAAAAFDVAGTRFILAPHSRPRDG